MKFYIYIYQMKKFGTLRKKRKRRKKSRKKHNRRKRHNTRHKKRKRRRNTRRRKKRQRGGEVVKCDKCKNQFDDYDPAAGRTVYECPYCKAEQCPHCQKWFDRENLLICPHCSEGDECGTCQISFVVDPRSTAANPHSKVGNKFPPQCPACARNDDPDFLEALRSAGWMRLRDDEEKKAFNLRYGTGGGGGGGGGGTAAQQQQFDSMLETFKPMQGDETTVGGGGGGGGGDAAAQDMQFSFPIPHARVGEGAVAQNMQFSFTFPSGETTAGGGGGGGGGAARVWRASHKNLYDRVMRGKVRRAVFAAARLTDNEAAMLSDAPATLTKLNLYSNQIGDKGASALAANTTLTQLNLGNNQISDEGATRLAANTTLTKLNLSGNQIGDEGATALAANETLTMLNLRNNRISGAEKVKMRRVMGDRVRFAQRNLFPTLQQQLGEKQRQQQLQRRRQLLKFNLTKTTPKKCDEIVRKNPHPSYNKDLPWDIL